MTLQQRLANGFSCRRAASVRLVPSVHPLVEVETPPKLERPFPNAGPHFSTLHATASSAKDVRVANLRVSVRLI